MSLYGSKCQIGGLSCGLVLRGSVNGEYRVVFEREYASLEQIEALNWDPPTIEGECVLPAGYGFTVKDIQYSAATRSYTVVLQVAEQYLGDVTGYQAQVAELQGTITEQAGTIQTQQNTIAEKDSTIAQQEETIQSQTATIDSQAAAIQELEAAGTAESVKAELQEAYVEGVESNG